MKHTLHHFSKQNIKNYIYSSSSQLDGFNSMVKYLVSLRRDQIIDDEVFSELVTMAASKFIEYEISERIEHAVETKINPALFMEFRK